MTSGAVMRNVTLAAASLVAGFASAAFADDGATARPPNPWDLAFGAGLYSDYLSRGILQSNHKPAENASFEPRYNAGDNLQLYAGLIGWSVALPNRGSTEIDLYAGLRPSFGKVAFDFGVWYYYYPGGQCFNSNLTASGSTFGGDCYLNGVLPLNGNVVRGRLSYLEYYGKIAWTPTDAVALGAALYYDPNWANTGANGAYAAATLKLTAPSAWTPKGAGLFVSAELGRYRFGTTDAFYCTSGAVTAPNPPANPPPAGQCGGGLPPAFPLATFYPNGVPLPDYTSWNVGVGLTWSVFTVDLRYYNSTLSESQCDVLTGDFTSTFNPAAINAINPSGFGSKWCGQTFVISLRGDLTWAGDVASY